MGLHRHEAVMVHASLRAVGWVEGGADAVLDELIRAVGPTGSLVMPTFHDFFLRGPGQRWDVDHTPSAMGALSEALRRRPDACRSAHPSHPLAVVGPLGAELCARSEGSAFAATGALGWLARRRSLVLLVGVGWSRCTFLHLAEEAAGVPYRRWHRLRGTVVQDGVARPRQLPAFLRRPWVASELEAAGAVLEAAGVVRHHRLGGARVLAVEGPDLLEVLGVAVAREPWLLGRRARPEELVLGLVQGLRRRLG